MDLFDDDDTHMLTINQHYAAAYAAKKEKEELSMLRDKYGPEDDQVDDADDSESDEIEDEEGEELTPAMDVAILKTLGRIRRGDPAIYDSQKNIFEEEEGRTADRASKVNVQTTSARKRTRPVHLRDMALAALLQAEDDGEAAPSHVQEQADLRTETISAFHQSSNVDGGDDDDDDLLIVRRSEDETEDAYRRYLVDEVGEDEVKAVLALDTTLPGRSGSDVPQEKVGKMIEGKPRKLKAKKTENKSGDEEFLLNYILNRGWIDRTQHRNPTYDDVIQSTSRAPKQADPEVVEDDSEFEEITERFESSYNFRFEEPNAAVIQTHPRNISSAVRRADDSRKQARERRNARKEEEKVKQQEELKRLKGLKRKEIEEKLKLLGVVSGKSDIASHELDLEGDFDPDSHDKQMREVFDEESYYGQVELEKPTWDDEIDISHLQPEDRPAKRKRRKTSTSRGMDDAVDWAELDFDTNMGEQSQTGDDSAEFRKRKLDEYMDEYFGLDYVDMVGDLPTRFKYTSVPATTYALTPAEILLATDAELNSYMGIKKYAPYRSERMDKGRGKRLWELKEVLKSRLRDAPTAEEHSEAVKWKKRRGKKERARERLAPTEPLERTDHSGTPQKADSSGQGGLGTKKRRKSHGAVES